MEEDDPATAAIIAAVIGSATSIGVTAYDHASAPGPNAGKPTPAEITKNAITAEQGNRQVATKEAAQLVPGLEANTSGATSPDYLKDVSATLSGNANLADSPQMKEMIAKFLGADTGATFGSDQPFGGGSSNFASPGLTG